jgi:GxxExxY protein
MNHRGTEAQRDALSEQVIGAAIDVHRALGPGLLESAHELCLCHELSLRELRFRRQIEIPIEYKGLKLDAGYRIDLIVEEKMVVELKSVERLLPIHEAQLLTYLKLSGMKTGLLLNFNEEVLRKGIKRLRL